MRHIPLLAEEGAERERDSAKPQERLRHQKNTAKPQGRRRRARSASAIARSRNSGQFGWPSKGRRTDHSVCDKSERIHCFDGRLATCRPVAPTGRAPVSKTGCWGFESLLACQFFYS